MGEEIAPLALVRDQSPIGNFGVPFEQHSADVEDDMANLVHAVRPFRFRRVAPGIAASMTFFITLGSASPASVCAGAHQQPGGACSIAGAVAQYTFSSSLKWVNTWTTVPGTRAPGRLNRSMSGCVQAAGAIHPIASGYFRHAAQ